MKRNFLLALAISLFLPSLKGTEIDEPVETRQFQLSVFPFIGTEGAYSQNYIYNFSLNIFAGITGGVDGFELGGFANINRYSMKGIQAAGFVNIVNEGIEGFQAAGFVNVVNGDAKVLQTAGFANVIGGELNGMQAAGFANVAKAVKGFQAAGFVNVSEKIEGMQAAGFVNVAESTDGIQAAGFVNIAGYAEGLQIGFINIADSIDGLPVGFLSIVRNGYRKTEFSGGDAMNLNLGLKIGVTRFYNILAAGSQFTGDESVFSYGYGIGSEFLLPENNYLNIEIISHHLLEDKWWRYEHMNLLGQLRVTYATDLNDRWQFFAGPVLNVQVRKRGAEGHFGSSIAPYHILEYSGRNTLSQMWVGINAGLRFW